IGAKLLAIGAKGLGRALDLLRVLALERFTDLLHVPLLLIGVLAVDCVVLRLLIGGQLELVERIGREQRPAATKPLLELALLLGLLALLELSLLELSLLRLGIVS